MDGYEFKRLVAMYYQDKGYEPQIVGGSRDHEVDIILTDPKEKYKIAVQCGKKGTKFLDAWCITTSNYTSSAVLKAAEGLNIRLLNGLHVQDQIGSWRKGKINN